MTTHAEIQKRCFDDMTASRERVIALVTRDVTTVLQINATATPSLQILLGSFRKMLERTKAISILCKQGYIDEIGALLRVQAETAINAAYIHSKGDQAAQRFAHFTRVAQQNLVQDFQTLTDRKFVLPDSGIDRINTLASEAKTVAGFKEKARTWDESTNLAKRARSIDDLFGSKLFSVLVASAYNSGHLYVHGDYSLLSRHLDQLLRDRDPDHVVMTAGVVNLMLGDAFCYYCFGFYLSWQFGFQSFPELSGIWNDVSRIHNVSFRSHQLHNKESGSNSQG